MSAARARTSVRRRGRRLAVVTAIAGTVGIAAGAFWLSFTALADLARRSGVNAGQAWAWPLIVDGIIVVATVAVVALAGGRSAWYPWVLLGCGAVVSVTANAIHAIVAADTDVPKLLAASVASVPPLVLLAITHLTVILTRPVPEGAPEPVVGAAVESTVEAVLQGTTAVGDAASVDDALAEVTASSPEPVALALEYQPPLPPAPEADDIDSPALPVPDGALGTGFTVGLGLEPPLDLGTRRAELPREAAREIGGVLHAQGWPNTRIAELLGVHKSTVGRWFPQTTAPQPSPPSAAAGGTPDEHHPETETPA